MKANLITVAKAAILGTALLLNGTAWAGAKYTPQVSVTATAAWGSMVGARYSSDNVQRIGCSLSGGVTQGSIFCSARDKNGLNLSCSSTDSWKLEAVQAITDSSYIYFTTNNYGLCTNLSVQNDSQFLK